MVTVSPGKLDYSFSKNLLKKIGLHAKKNFSKKNFNLSNFQNILQSKKLVKN